MAREIRSIEIEPAENGGHTVTHRFKSSPNPSKRGSLSDVYHEPETHVFGPDDDKKVIPHITKALGIKTAMLALLAIFLSLPAFAAPQTIQVTIGAAITQVSATPIHCRWVEFQNNAGHVIRLGDINTTSSRGISLAASGAVNSSFLVPPTAQTNALISLQQWYIVGTQNDVVDVVCDTVAY